MKFRFLPHLVFVLFIPLLVFSQNETKKWYFGDHAGLDFATNPPTILTNGALTGYEGCSTISDANGNLLFYTEGTTIYNASHTVMPNGSGLLGNTSSTEGAMIIKKPGSSSIYYLFILADAGGANGLTYNVIDVSLASGQGSVTAKNIPIVSPCSERMTAVRHCNGTDVWLLAQPVTSSTVIPSSSVLKAYLVSAAGVNTVGVTSNINNAGQIPFVGYMKFSPSGKRMAYCINGLITGSSLILADFDASTGVVSNTVALVNASSIFNYYGVEFSPDGTKLFGAGTVNNTSQGFIFQWDLCAGSTSAILATQYTVTLVTNTQLWALQTGFNGKIYNSRFGQTSLGVINNPNVYGSGCNYVHNGQSIAPNFGYLGLPNFITSSLRTPTPFTYSVSNLFGCQTATFTCPPVLQTASLVSCAASGYSFTGVEWDFGDPASGSANSSTLLNPIHAYSNVGTYTAQLIVHYSCGGGTNTIKQQVVANQLCISLNSNSVSCSTLGTATAVVNSGIGPFSYVWAPGGQTTAVISGVTPGSYTVTVYDAGNNITSTESAVFSPPQQLSGNVNNTSSLSCYGALTGTANVTNINGGSPNQNYYWTNGVQSYTTATVNTLSGGIWSVTVTDALTACSFSNAFYIIQPPAITLNISASSPTACAGNSVVLQGTANGGTGGYTYNWVSGPPNNSLSVSQSTGGTYIYTLSATDAYTCSVINTISIDFINNPVLTVSNVSVCPLQTGTLTANGATSYTWNLNSTGLTFTDNPLVSTQYSVTGSALGCSSSTTATIFLKTTPVITIANTVTVCAGSSLNLSATGGTAFLWSGPNSYTGINQNNTITSVSSSNAGVYTVTVTAANSCTASATSSVVIVPLPVVNISSSSASICANTTSTSLSATGTATLFNWLPNQSLSSNTANIVSAFPPSTKVYTLVGSLNNCTSSATSTVYVVPTPSINFSVNSQSLCAQALNGSPNTITLTAGGASTYSITTPSQFNNTNPSGPTTAINLAAPYIYNSLATATILASNGVCIVKDTVVFSVIPNPTVQLNNYSPVICIGQTFTYNASGAGTYSWTSATSGSSLLLNGNLAATNATLNSVFSVFGENLGCKSATQNTTLTVNPLPTVAVTPNATFVCIGKSTTLKAESNATSFYWSPLSGLSTTTGKEVIASPVSGQNYTVVASLNNCTNTAHAIVSVMPLPTVSIQNLKPLVCINDEIELKGFGGKFYTWQNPAGLVFKGQSIKLNAVTPSYAGVYKLTVLDSNFCESTATTIVSIKNAPDGVIIGGDFEACVPFSLNFIFKPSINSEPVSSQIWTINNNPVSKNNLDIVTPGIYNLSCALTGTNNCINTINSKVIAREKPIADFTFTPERPIENADEVLFINHSKGIGITKFSWFFNNNSTKPISNETATYQFNNEGIYPVVLVVENTWGCADTVIKNLNVEQDFVFYVPNAFTPNADGINDFFMPVYRGVISYNLTIFNRWGEKVFESDEKSAAWDGSMYGKECEQNVYVWKASVTNLKGELKKYSGHLTLYR